MGSVRFVPNPEIGAIISKTQEMATVLFEAAAAAAMAAKGFAPVKSGEYRDSITPYPRVGEAAVVSNDYKAAWIEFGTGPRAQKTTGRFTGQEPAYAPLRRGAEAVGLRFVPGTG